MECFLQLICFYMGLQILVVSWTRLFLQQKCFGGISLIFVSYIIYRPNVQAMYDEFCLVEMLQPNANLLIGGEHITYDP